MKSIFLGKHMVKKKYQNPLTTMKHIITENEINRWEQYYECELVRELKERDYININGETEIEKVIYEIDGSITYKTTRVLSQM
jgi:hypothetical protein